MEARIYKTKRRRNGKRVVGRVYRARVKLDGDDKVRDIALKVTDRQVAQQKLNEIVPNWNMRRRVCCLPRWNGKPRNHRCSTWWRSM